MRCEVDGSERVDLLRRVYPLCRRGRSLFAVVDEVLGPSPDQELDMKKFARRTALALAALAATAGLVAAPAPSQAMADTGWGCGGACSMRK